MPNSIQSFIKGMNTDTDVSSLPKGTYRRAENFTFTTIEGGTSGALENVKGNTLFTQAGPIGSFDFEIVGYINIIEDIVFFTYRPDDGALPAVSAIWVYDHVTKTTSLFYSDESTADGSKLNFSNLPKDRIVGIGRYENEKIRKIYWTDGVEEVRYANLERDYIGLSVDAFSLLPTINLGTIKVTEDSILEGGTLKAGAVQYVYRLFNKYGAESNFSSATHILYLTEDIASGSTKFLGTDKGKLINKAANIFFENVDTGFDFIRVYSIFYQSLYDTPTISLIHEGHIPSDTFSIIDIGNMIEEIPLETYNSLGGRLFTAKVLASKNNILFAANIKEEYFDLKDDNGNSLDCRAYRFDHNGAPISGITNSDGTETITIQTDGSWSSTSGDADFDWSIPTDFDCINTTNDIYNNNYIGPNEIDFYLYDTDGNIGGTGKYIDYKVVKEKGSAILGDFTPKTNKDVYLRTSFKINEVYRLGIVFFDKKGRQSFVNWVGDILIPYFNESGTLKYHFDIEDISGSKWVYPIYTTIEFKIKFSEFPSEFQDKIKGFKIVSAERNIKNSTSYVQGFSGSIWRSDSTPLFKSSSFGVVADAFSKDSYYFTNFYSPDITIGKAKNNYVSSKLLPVAKEFADTLESRLREGDNGSTNNSFTKIFTDSIVKDVSGDLFTIKEAFNLIRETGSRVGTTFTGRWDENTTGTVVVESVTYENRFQSLDTNSDMIEAYSPETMLLTTDDGILTTSGTTTTSIQIWDVIKDNANSIYGGITYSNRFNNIYIPCSEYVNLISVGQDYTVEAEGDVFISIYEQMLRIYDQDWTEGLYETFASQHLFMVPLESSINYTFANAKPSYYMDNKFMVPPDVAIEEEQAVGIAKYPDKYPNDLGDLYSYNNVYSLPAYGLFPKYTPKPLLFEADQTNHVMVVASEKKTNGEYVDNWTKFLYANLIEVDTEYGGITELKSLDNKLFFWQKKAFGALAVNDRSLLKDQSGSQLSLGSGGVLERYDYFSNNIGVLEKYNVTNSENALFWVYTPSERIYTFDNQIKELSTTSSINSYLHEAAKAHPFETPISVVDYTNHETLFRINDEVLVYSWLSNSFTGVYTFIPYWFIKMYDGNYASVSKDSKDLVWLHNSIESSTGSSINRASFYGPTSDSYIKFVVNDNYLSTKVFDNISWFSTSVNSNGTNIYGDTFKEVRFTTDYQNTDWVNLYIEDNVPSNIVKNITRRERSFFMQIPRDKVIKSQDVNPNIFIASNLEDISSPVKFKRRMRDKFMNVELKYDNTSGNKFFFPYVNVSYRQSIR